MGAVHAHASGDRPRQGSTDPAMDRQRHLSASRRISCRQELTAMRQKNNGLAESAKDWQPPSGIGDERGREAGRSSASKTSARPTPPAATRSTAAAARRRAPPRGSGCGSRRRDGQPCFLGTDQPMRRPFFPSKSLSQDLTCSRPFSKDKHFILQDLPVVGVSV